VLAVYPLEALMQVHTSNLDGSTNYIWPHEEVRPTCRHVDKKLCEGDGVRKRHLWENGLYCLCLEHIRNSSMMLRGKGLR